MQTNDASARQRQLYIAMHDEYERHYYDEPSLRYRRQFLLGPLLDGLNLNHLRVADFASGSGYNSTILRERFPHVRTVGLDISPRACQAYRALTGEKAFEIDLMDSVNTNQCGRFDAGIIVGGLHHLSANIERAIHNIAALLHPGAPLLMIEPNREFLFGRLRDVWYKRDRYFDETTERALAHDALLGMARSEFESEFVDFVGGPAYFTVLNSLVLRIPVTWKPVIARALFPFEHFYNSLPGRWPFPAFIARWRRHAVIAADIGRTP